MSSLLGEKRTSAELVSSTGAPTSSELPLLEGETASEISTLTARAASVALSGVVSGVAEIWPFS